MGDFVIFSKELFNSQHWDDTDLSIRYKEKLIPILTRMETRKFKFSVACISLLSYPFCITLSVVLSSSAFLTLLIMLQLITIALLFPRTFIECLVLYKHLLNCYYISLALLSILFTAGLSIFLLFLIPSDNFLRWSWLQYLSSADESEDESEDNLLNFGFKATIAVSILFMIILYLILPVAAYFEEVIFRRGTKNWKDGSLRSLLFGCVHMTMGVPIIIALIPLSLMGFFLTREYFEGIRRQKERDFFSQNLEDEILDDTRRSSHQCNPWPHAGVPCFGEIVPGSKDWNLVIPIEKQRHWFSNKSTGEKSWEKPLCYVMKDEGTRSSTRLHFAHNFIAVTITVVMIILSQFIEVPFKV